MDTIFRMFVSVEMLTNLKVFVIAYIMSILVCLSSLLGILTCLGVTESCYVSKL